MLAPFGRSAAAAHPAGEPLEDALLRRSVGALSADRTHCHHCRRTPLVGERVYVYESPSGDRLVCELCRPLRREPPARDLLVRSAGIEIAVRRL